MAVLKTLTLTLLFASIVAATLGFIDIMQPKETSLWVANGKTRRVVFSYEEKDVDSWVVELFNSRGVMIHGYPADTLLPNKRAGKTIFEKHAVVPEELDSGKYKLRLCGFVQDERKLCNESKGFLIEGNQRKHNDKSNHQLEPHEARHQARIEAVEEHLMKLDVQEVWPIHETRCNIRKLHRPTKGEFTEKCMKTATPCIISGVTDEWKAMKNWQFEVFQNDSRISEGVYIGEGITPVQLSSYVEYLKQRAANESSPWVIFMSEVFDLYPDLREDYTAPEFFSESDDFLTGVDEDLRLDWRWIIMAPKRSGSGWHVDPANTTGWLALVQGAKLWGMYPPSVYHIPGVRSNYYQKREYQPEDAFYWWIYTRPYLQSNLPMECVQMPGDIVFIPSGWWHSVLNLEDTVGVTQNFCNKYSLKICLTELREQADSDGLFIGRTFEQLRELYSRNFPQYFEEQDFDFKAPRQGEGLTETEEKSRRQQMLKDYLLGKSSTIV